ncbi:phosphatases II [Coniochaeta ligniaria NRRL 30616]|uniref:Phosphatases II n=1 Tax=Coniochaeta ligniaria NRRL 30616 TaxID=1408157 RepID=A0A1J7J9N6_9PEZI|nr:phosphatases II [Coniochaeta ligniaria NRRL 30616]
MEKHIQRFRRSRKDPSTPTVLQPSPPSTTTTPPTSTSTATTTTTTTPPTSLAPPGTPPSNTLSLPLVSTKPPRKLSPFRGFHLRGPASHKRARDSPPASVTGSSSIPHSPVDAVRPRTAHAYTATATGAGAVDGGAVGLGVDGAGDEGRRKGGKGKRMPRFLEVGDKEILEKFSDLVWQERNRLAASSTNPSPSHRWARVSGPHLRVLDRYVNIQPWQNNRVRLKVPEGGVDYINASPVVLYPTKNKKGATGKEGGNGGQGEEANGGVEEGEVHRYIAMQGPKQSSQDHVWRMVVEQLESPGVIVMLTETHEAGQEKCWQYFPRGVGETIEVNPADEFGDGFGGTVTCEGMEETPAGDAIELRRLVVRVRRRRDGEHERGREGLDMERPGSGELLDKMRSPTADIREGIGRLSSFGQSETRNEELVTPVKDEDLVEERVVYHFLYKKWPDFGVPALEDLESFFTLMRLSREKNANPSNPRIVHCSAGVGRSGTFIALEHLMRELDAGVLEDWDEEGDAKKAAEAEKDGENGDGQGMDEREESGVDMNEGEDMIFNTVNALREQRRTMVQADAQYLFIYQVMRKLWMDKYGGGPAASGREGSGEPAAKRLEVDPFVG